MYLRHKSIRSRILATTSAAAVGVATAGVVNTVAIAQDDAADERIVVTGSRIVRRDYQANSPIVTVDSEDFETSTGLNVESYLNRLPQFNPAASPTAVGAGGNNDVQPTAGNSIGISTLSLRGLGANRNLVLVDGKRLTPINGSMAVDVNAVPSSMIQRVEIITGGASAVYGADAVGGVVNFILRDNFEGLELDAQYGMAEVGDGEESRLSALFGANTSDGRGNVTFAAEVYSRSPAWQRNRDFYTEAWNDPYVGTNEFFTPAMYYGSTGTTRPDQAVVDFLFDEVPADRNVLNSANFNFNPDGTVWTGTGGAGAAGSYRYNGPFGDYSGGVIGFQNVYDTHSGSPVDRPVGQAIRANSDRYYASSPIERYSFYGSGKYDITDSVEAFVKGTFVNSYATSNLFSSPAITGWGVAVPYDPTTDSPIDPTLDYSDPAAALASTNPNFIASGQAGAQHPVTPELALLLNSRAVQDDAWNLNFIPESWFPDRSTENSNETWQIDFGFRGELPFKDWGWEAYVSHGQSSSYNLGRGYMSLERYQALMQAPDYARNASIPGNLEAPNFGFGAATGECTSGFYDTIFGGNVAPSDDCIDSATALLQSRTEMEQNLAEVNLQGGLFEMPAGEVRFAAGASYRDNSLIYNPDVLQSVDSFIDQVIGVYPTAYMDASTYTNDVYGELLVPIISDVPLIQQLDVELGIRGTSYETTDSDVTYKILGDWTVNDYLRVRGGYNLANRAPNLAEQFLGLQQVFAGGAFTQYGDQCSTGTLAPFGANPDADGATAESAANTLAICQAFMTPTGAAEFYQDSNPGSFNPGFPTGFLFTNQVGNPDLESEQAETYTLGFVATSPFTNPWLEGFSGSLDYYQIEITDAIQFQAIDTVRAACYTQDFAVATAPGNVPCSFVARNPGTGGQANTTIAYDNLATIDTAGLDLAVNWTAQFEDLGVNAIPGGVGLNVLVNYLDHYDTTQDPTSPTISWKGSLGPTLSGTNPGAYEYKTFTTFNYFTGPASVSLRWRHLPEVVTADYAVNPAADNSLPVKKYDVFDLSGTWQLNDTVAFRGGVDNVLDARPIRTGADTGQLNVALPNPGTGSTNTGYYDVLGRRFFVGVKMTY